MDHIRLDIVTDDRAYGSALAKSLAARSDVFRARVRDCDEYIACWKKKGSAVRDDSDLVLWDGEEGRHICSGDIIWIREDEKEPECGGHSICRYQPVPDMCGRLIDIYAGLTGVTPAVTATADTRVLAFISWQGGSGCSTLCHAVAQELTRFYGKKILILSMDGFGSGEAGVEDADPVFGADAFLYRFFHRREGLETEQFTIKYGYGVSFLAPSSGRNPLPQLTEEEGKKLMSALVSGGGFDGILIDAGNCFSDGATAMIDFADRLCCVEKRTQAKREGRCLSYLEQALRGRLRSTGVIKAINGAVSSSPEAASRSKGNGGPEAASRSKGNGNSEPPAPAIYMKTITLAPRINEQDQILLEGEFGNNVHELTELLWYNKN